MTIPILETPDLILRPWTAQDAEALLQILQEPDILQYFPLGPPPSIEKVERYIAHHQAHWQERGYGHWAVIARQDGRLLGWNGLEYLPESDETEVAYLLSHQAWGRGYATQTARRAVRFGFETAGLESIIGLVHPDNIGSIRVLEKCGLKRLDRKTYWGLELERYRIGRRDYQEMERIRQS